MDENNLVANDEDKIKSVQEIIKDVNESAEEKKKDKPKRKYTKKKKPDIKMEPVPEVITQIQELTTQPFESEDDYKKKLCQKGLFSSNFKYFRFSIIVSSKV